MPMYIVSWRTQCRRNPNQKGASSHWIDAPNKSIARKRALSQYADKRVDKITNVKVELK
jgi:hypothetical protein